MTDLTATTTVLDDKVTCIAGSSHPGTSWMTEAGGLSLSPNGLSLAAASTGYYEPNLPAATTRIFKGGALVNNVAGWGAKWLDDNQLLANLYAVRLPGPIVYVDHTVTYDSLGNVLAAPPPPSLPPPPPPSPLKTAGSRLFVGP